DEVPSRGLGVGHDRAEHRTADELPGGVAEEVLAVVVEEDHASLRIPAQDDRVRPVDDVPVRRFVRAEPRELVAELLVLLAERVRIGGGRHSDGTSTTGDRPDSRYVDAAPLAGA